jgi:hypothetical protein
MNKWDAEAIQYTDVEKLKASLVGRSIVSTVSEGIDYSRVLSFVLDDGSILKAHATDGGCACNNGCFTVEPGNVVQGTILNVDLEEEAETFDWDADGDQYVKRLIEPGSISDGSATIRVFVYSELGKQVLVSSEGGDNGYYGWGFWLSVQAPEVSA